MTVLNKFDDLLKQKRANENRVITLEEIARSIGVSRDALSRYQQQKITRYDSDMVEAICRYFEVEVGDFLYLNPSIQAKQSETQQ